MYDVVFSLGLPMVRTGNVTIFLCISCFKPQNFPLEANCPTSLRVPSSTESKNTDDSAPASQKEKTTLYKFRSVQFKVAPTCFAFS